ncbi:MAG: YciI family protein [Burkholderiaceae bacterium]
MLGRAAATKTWIAAFALVCAVATAAETPASPLFVVHFETGRSWNKSLAPSDQPGFREHSANLNRLRKEGTIVFGARYADLGMIFVRAGTLDQAKALMEADPGVQSGIFSYRIEPLRVFYPWQP